MSENYRELRRGDGMIAGVCVGLGDYFQLDPVIFRVIFVLLALPGGLPGILLYLLLWIVIPSKQAQA